MRKDNVSIKNVKTINTQTGEVKQSRVETTTLDERPSIWNIQAFVIVFLFILLGTTINVYSSNNDNLTWIDSNGDFKVNSYDHSMINLDTDLLELNNQSLNDVFRDSNVLTDNGFNTFNTNLFETTVLNDIINVRMLTDTRANYQNPFSWIYNYDLSSDTAYLGFEFYTENATKLRVRDNAGSLYPQINDTYEWVHLSFIRAFGSSYTGTYFQISFFENLVTDDEVQFKNLVYINLSDLGINQTQDEMDDWYNLYVSLQENRIEAYKQLGNEPISQWQNLTQYLQLVIDAVTGPINNISDWINKFMNGLFS